MRIRFSGHLGIVVAVLMVLMVLVPTQEATAQGKTFKLKFQASWPVGSTLYDNFKMFAKRVDEMSGGRLKIETLPSGAIVPAFEVVPATSRGLIDGAHTAAGYLLGKHRAAIPISHGPVFGMDYIDYFGWYFNGGGNELKNEWYQKILRFNVVAFPILPAGPQALGWFKAPVKDWDDFKGYKFRIYGLGNEVFKDAGMAVVTLPGAEILPALERGTLDGAEWVGGYEDLKMGFHDVLKVHLTPGMHEPVTVGDLIINKDVWNKLGPEFRAMMEAASTETFWRWFTWWHGKSADAYKTLVEKHKVEVYRTPDDILMRFVRGWEKLRKKDAAADPFYAKVIESQRKYAERVVPYRRSVWPDYSFLADFYWKDKIFLK